MIMFKQKQFPPLTDSTEDGIISVCWQRGYRSVAELEQLFREMYDGTEWYLFDADDDEWMKEREAECMEWVKDGGLQSLTSIR